MLPEGFPRLEFKGGDAGSGSFFFPSSNVDDPAIIENDGVGTVSEEVFLDFKTCFEITLPNYLSGLKLEAMELSCHSD